MKPPARVSGDAAHRAAGAAALRLLPPPLRPHPALAGGAPGRWDGAPGWGPAGGGSGGGRSRGRSAGPGGRHWGRRGLLHRQDRLGRGGGRCGFGPRRGLAGDVHPDQRTDAGGLVITDRAAVALGRNGELLGGIEHVLVVQAQVLRQLVDSHFAAAGHSERSPYGGAERTPGPHACGDHGSSCLRGCGADRSRRASRPAMMASLTAQRRPRWRRRRRRASSRQLLSGHT